MGSAFSEFTASHRAPAHTAFANLVVPYFSRRQCQRHRLPECFLPSSCAMLRLLGRSKRMTPTTSIRASTATAPRPGPASRLRSLGWRPLFHKRRPRRLIKRSTRAAVHAAGTKGQLSIGQRHGTVVNRSSGGWIHNDPNRCAPPSGGLHRNLKRQGPHYRPELDPRWRPGRQRAAGPVCKGCSRTWPTSGTAGIGAFLHRQTSPGSLGALRTYGRRSRPAVIGCMIRRTGSTDPPHRCMSGTARRGPCSTPAAPTALPTPPGSKHCARDRSQQQ